MLKDIANQPMVHHLQQLQIKRKMIWLQLNAHLLLIYVQPKNRIKYGIVAVSLVWLISSMNEEPIQMDGNGLMDIHQTLSREQRIQIGVEMNQWHWLQKKIVSLCSKMHIMELMVIGMMLSIKTNKCFCVLYAPLIIKIQMDT